MRQRRADTAPRILNDLFPNRPVAGRKLAVREPRVGFAAVSCSPSEGSVVLDPMLADRTPQNITSQDGLGYR